eukprot:jgi/Botrbrau1/4701/Bobra.0218s0022.1
MARSRTNHVTLAVLLCVTVALTVAADSPLNQPDTSSTNPVEGSEETPKIFLTQQVQATLPVEEIQKLDAYLQEAVPSLTNPLNNEVTSSPSTESILGTPLNPMEQLIPTDPAIPDPSIDRASSAASAGDLTTEEPAGASEQATVAVAMNPVDDMWTGPGSMSVSPTPQYPLHNPLDDLTYIKKIETESPERPLEPSSEPNLVDFCSKRGFTIEEAEAHAAKMRAIRGAKPPGFQGAPYVPLAPWACDSRVPATQEDIPRLPGPRARLAKRAFITANFTGKKALPQYGIQFHGGPVTNPLRFYYIWYGTWPIGNKSPTDTTTVKILEDLAKSLGGSCIWSTTTTYTDRNGVPISNSLNFAGSISVTQRHVCYQTSTIDYNSISNIAACLRRNNYVANTANTQYMVLASKDIRFSGYCSSWCGWHDYMGGNIVGYVGSSASCSSCTSQTRSPNNNAEADSMASTIFHELTETATDPHIDAWYNQNENENADLCAWTYGTKYTTPSPGGGKYNTRTTCPAGASNCVSRYWLLQQNWHNVPSRGICGKGVLANCNPIG